MRSQLWEHDYRLGVEYYQVLSMGLLMAPLPVVRIRCHDHCEVLAQRLVHRYCREILAPSLAHSLSSQRLVLDKRPSPPDIVIRAKHYKMAFSTHISIRGLVLRRSGGPGKAQESERTVPKSPGFLATVAPCPSQAPGRRARGRHGEVSGRERSARASFWAPAGPALFLALFKPPGQEENLSCEVRGPEEEGSPQNEEVVEDRSQTPK